MSPRRKTSRARSRKSTPWDGLDNLDPTQKLIRDHTIKTYEDKHLRLLESGETEMINSHVPKRCPFCGSESFVRRGFTNNMIQRYKCGCGKTFTPTTGTIFESHKIPVTEWFDYCRNLFQFVSINASSWNNMNAFSTSKFWLNKIFLTLEDYQSQTILTGDVWFDETFYPLIFRDLERNEDGSKLSGISRNQICIGAAVDKENVYLVVEGRGKHTKTKCYNAFIDHIAPGSTLIHDGDNTHSMLVEALHLKSEVHPTSETKGLDDKHNPLNTVNQVHNGLKKFLNAHSGFTRDELAGYVNLYAFVRNPPDDYRLKTEKFIKMAFENPRALRYRDQIPKDGE